MSAPGKKDKFTPETPNSRGSLCKCVISLRLKFLGGAAEAK